MDEGLLVILRMIIFLMTRMRIWLRRRFKTAESRVEQLKILEGITAIEVEVLGEGGIEVGLMVGIVITVAEMVLGDSIGM